MKTKIINSACGLAAASIFALAFTACDSDSPSAPTGGDEKSSAIESSDADKVSSSSEGTTISCDALSTECGYTEEELCRRGVPGYCGNELVEISSSSEVGPASSSAEKRCEAFMPECGYSEEELCGMGYTEYCGSSSSMQEKCIDMEKMCPPCVEIDGQSACPLTNVACNHCDEEGATMPACKASIIGYVCSDHTWKQIMSEPVCEHISDYDGMTANGNCVGRNGEVVTDCATEQEYKCVDNYWTPKNIVCPPGGDCDGDGIPDGIRRPDLEPCDTEGSTLEFYNRYFVCNNGAWNRIDKQACNENGSTKAVGDFSFQCVSGKWEYLPPPITYINENATDVSAMNRGGPAVTPRIVKVQSASGSVTFRDDGVLVDNNCTFNGLNAELRGDTLFATILYPGCTTTGGHMGVITFTLGIDFADVKYIKYSDSNNVKPVFEVDELLPCGNTSSCNTCGGDTDDPRVGC